MQNLKQKTYREAFLGYIYDALEESKGTLKFEQISKIFLSVLKDYFTHIVDVHTISSIASALYFGFNKPSSFDINPSTGKLGNLLERTSDLEWVTKNKGQDEANQLINDLKKYYQENKKFIEKSS